MKKENVILIGMPGVGKSTIGVVLAKMLGYRFLDSDLVIQEQTGKLLYQLIEEHGLDEFEKIENSVNAGLNVHRAVVATGGSTVYGAEAMAHLAEIGTVIYLKLSCETIRDRLGDLHERGVAMMPGQTLESLYEERTPLYERYGEVTIDCEGKKLREIAREILAYVQ